MGTSPSFVGCSLPLPVTNYLVATNGDDSNVGMLDKPFVILQKMQSRVVPGDTVYIRGGEHRIREGQMVGGGHLRAYVFEMNRSGIQARRICYIGYQDERPIFSLVEVKPEGKWVSISYVSGPYFHFRNFEIIKTQVTIREHTQLECIYNQDGNHNIYGNPAMHDGMAIGFYLIRGGHSLVLDCNAYNDFDPVFENSAGGNVDDFGGHPASASYTGNMFRGCRIWYNSDDGFDLMKVQTAYTIEDCQAFYDGYEPGGFMGAGDGTRFKAGGYGMRLKVKMSNEVPHHVAKDCLVYKNRSKGFYANHHLGGTSWFGSIGHQNPSNFCMLNRKSPGEIVDVDGYDRIIWNNSSYKPRAAGKHIIGVNRGECTIINNSFLPVDMIVGGDDFVSLGPIQSTLPHKTSGSLSDIGLLKLEGNSKLYGAGVGFQFSAQNL